MFGPLHKHSENGFGEKGKIKDMRVWLKITGELLLVLLQG